MSKKNKKPQVRKRQKPTVGQLEFTNVVYMERELVDGKVQIFGTCTCKKWRSSPEATTITKVGLEAKQHVIDSDGKCALRSHPVEPTAEDVPAVEEVMREVEAGFAGETPIEIDP